MDHLLTAIAHFETENIFLIAVVNSIMVSKTLKLHENALIKFKMRSLSVLNY